MEAYREYVYCTGRGLSHQQYLDEPVMAVDWHMAIHSLVTKHSNRE